MSQLRIQNEHGIDRVQTSTLQQEIDSLKAKERSIRDELKCMNNQHEKASKQEKKPVLKSTSVDNRRSQQDSFKRQKKPCIKLSSLIDVLKEELKVVANEETKVKQAACDKKKEVGVISSERSNLLSFLQKENAALKKQLAEARAKKKVEIVEPTEQPVVKHEEKYSSPSQPIDRMSASKEGAHWNQIAILKIRLAEVDRTRKEEQFRAKQDRKACQRRDVVRLQMLERLRQEKENLENVNSNLDGTIIALRMELARNSIDIGRTSRRRSEMPAKIDDAFDKNCPHVEAARPAVSTTDEPYMKIAHIRNKLSLARDRIITARENSRPVHSRNHSLLEKPDDHSHANQVDGQIKPCFESMVTTMFDLFQPALEWHLPVIEPRDSSRDASMKPPQFIVINSPTTLAVPESVPTLTLSMSEETNESTFSGPIFDPSKRIDTSSRRIEAETSTIEASILGNTESTQQMLAVSSLQGGATNFSRKSFHPIVTNDIRRKDSHDCATQELINTSGGKMEAPNVSIVVDLSYSKSGEMLQDSRDDGYATDESTVLTILGDIEKQNWLHADI